MAQKKSLIAPDGSARRWAAAILVSVLVFGLMAYGLGLRPAYVSSATVRIGGILDSGTGGIPHFVAFDGANEVEYFYSNEVFSGMPEVASNCTVNSRYSPDGGRVQFSCKAGTEERARELTETALKPMLDRHARKSEIAEEIDAHRRTLIEQQARGYQQSLDILLQAPVSALTKVQIIEYQLKLEALRERQILDRALGQRVRRSGLEGSTISVTDRRPTTRTWALVAALALFAGLFVASFSWILKRLGYDPARHDA